VSLLDSSPFPHLIPCPFRHIRLTKLTHLPSRPSISLYRCSFFLFLSENSPFVSSDQTGTNGAGETYNYLPTSAHQPESYCQTGPESHCNPDYGDSSERPHPFAILPLRSSSSFFRSFPWLLYENPVPLRSKMADSMISLMSGYSRKGLVLLHPRTMGDRHPADQAQRCWQFERSVHSALSFLFTPNQKKANLFWVYMYRCWTKQVRSRSSSMASRSLTFRGSS
jgi:hypothetical protein